jgi:hypothetical protein
MADKNEIKKQIEIQIEKLSGETAQHYKDQLDLLEKQGASLIRYQQTLGDVNNTVYEMSSSFSKIRSQLDGIVKELKNSNSNSRDIVKSFEGLRSIAQKLKNDQQGITDLNLEQLKKEQSKVKVLQEQLKASGDIARDRLAAGEEITAQEQAILDAETENLSIIQQINKELDERIEKEEEINKKLGITGVLLTGISKIPIVGPLLKTNEALDAAREKAKAGGNAFQVMGAGLSSMGKSLANSLKDPLVVIGLLVKGFQALLKLGFMVDKQETQLAKSFALSESSAHGLRNTLNDIQASSAKNLHYQERSLVNTTALVEASTQLGDALGASVIPTQDQLENQIMLTKQIGLSVEEANNLQKLAFDNRMSADDITKEVIKQTKSYRNQTGVQLDNKKILQDVSKISGQLRLQYGNNVKQLTAAVVQSQKLGLSLEQTKKIAEGLLNFEESIENELSAELLIGRDLNLEQARLLALNGKSAEATALIAQQMGGSAEFSRLNVIQQESLAKALGMSADELADSMVYQERLNSLGSIGQQQVTDRIAELEKEGRFEEAQQLQREIANGTAAEEALKRVDEQTKFNASIEKLKLLLADVVDGPAQALTKWITGLAESAASVKGLIIGIGLAISGISLSKLLINMASLAVSTGAAAAGALTWAGGITLGFGLVGIGVAIAAAMGAFESSKEKAAKPPTNSNYASGGIVGGNSLAGDNMKINANSGEMVLNRRQQANLFKLANGGGGGGPIQVTVYGQIDKKTLFTFMAEGERTNSNNLASERQLNNRPTQ